MTLIFTIFLITAVLMLVVGFYGIIVSRNLIRIVLSIEVLTKSATLLMIGAGYVNGEMASAQSHVITIIVLEVMLLVIIIGILNGIYRKTGGINTDSIRNLKG